VEGGSDAAAGAYGGVGEGLAGGSGSVACGGTSGVGSRLDDVGEADEKRLAVAHRLAGCPMPSAYWSAMFMFIQSDK